MTLQYHYTVPGDDFVHAGEASGHLKGVLRQLGYPGDTIRRVAISMYEGEINMVIHANGGEIDAEIDDRGVTVTLRDQGPGIPDVEKAMQEGWSTASDEIRSQGFGAGSAQYEKIHRPYADRHRFGGRHRHHLTHRPALNTEKRGKDGTSTLFSLRNP